MRLPRAANIYRSLGHGSPWDRLGCGVMDKSGWQSDLDDYDPPTWSLVFLLRGNGTFSLTHGRNWELHPGMCFLRMPGVRHSTRPDPQSGWLEAFIDLGPSISNGLLAGGVLQSEPLVWMWGLAQDRVDRFGRLRSRLEAADERELPAIAKAIIELAIQAQRGEDAETTSADIIVAACRHLADTCTRRDDLQSWCQAQGLDYDRFRKRFRARMGMAPGEYRLRRRMDRACALLQSSAQSIAAIAAQLGYPTPYEFSAQFRKRMGLPPSAYRRR